MSKVFVIGLPRTGTTSVCVSLLALGYRVAHTAYTKHSFDLADAVADAPVFADYPQLDRLFPESKFIYLERNEAEWLPSIASLLSRLWPKLDPDAGRYNPIIRRSYFQVFAPLNCNTLADSQHLLNCYRRHRQQAIRYFEERPQDFLRLDIQHSDSLARMADFLGKSPQCDDFPHLNRDGEISAWDKLKHPLKVSANAAGPERRRFFDYAD